MALAPLVALVLAPPAGAVGLKRVGRFAQPVYAAAPAGDRHDLYVVERRGVVRVIRDGRVRRRPFLDIRRRVLVRSSNVGIDQRGLLSIAFAPDFSRSRRVYAFYVGNDSLIHVDEFRRGSRRAILSGPGVGPYDHGGQLQFGPDRQLYVSIGQSGHPGSSQDLGSRRGKLIRVNPRTRAHEMYARGLRNPFRFSFDAETGDLAIGDNGEHELDEVDFLPVGTPAGANFGWPLYEGTRHLAGRTPSNYVAPVLVHPHNAGWCSMIGGYVVRTASLPSLQGRYLYGDTCTGAIRSAILDTPRARGDRRLGIRVPGLSSFGVDGQRRVYAMSVTSGRVYRIVR